MFRKFVLPGLAVAGVVIAAYTVAKGSQVPPVAQPVADPAQPPFQYFIAGSGIIEAASRNIAIGSPLARLVIDVPVHVGSDVKAGGALFRLDDRDLQAELAVRRAAVAASGARLARLVALPRPEDVPPAVAKVVEAEASLADAKNQQTLAESVSDKRAISAEETAHRRFAAQQAEARLVDLRAQLALLKAGTWKEDLDVARADLASAEQQVHQTMIETDRLIVRAPVDGTVLQLNVRVGEFAPAGVLATPLVVFGSVHPLHVRVDIDENDAWRFRAGAKAVGYVRGNRDLSAALKFEYVEPYIVPKVSLTGDTTERVDTRVMQVVYSFEKGTLPVYVGEQLDIFIESPGKAHGARGEKGWEKP